jgi:hypothetical protein
MALVCSSRHRERETAENRRDLEKLQQQGRTSYGNLLKTVLYIICTNLLHIHLARAGVDLLYFSPYNCDWEEPRECLKIRVFEMSERRAFQCTVHGGQAPFFFFGDLPLAMGERSTAGEAFGALHRTVQYGREMYQLKPISISPDSTS